MAILSGDIKILVSERLTDNDDGGGQITGTEIIDGASNNIFPDVSDLDRVYGRIRLRKLAMSVHTDNTDTLYGSMVTVDESPEDDKTSILLFATGVTADERANAQNRIESYLVMGPLSRYIPLGNQLTGQKTILCYAREDVPLPETGDVYVLNFDGQYQYVRLTGATGEMQTFEDADGVFQRFVIVMEISDALRNDYSAPSAPSRYTSNIDDTTQVMLRTTTVADAATYFGMTQLAEPISSGDMTLKVDSIFGQLVPSATVESPILDASPAGERSILTPAADGVIDEYIYFRSYQFIYYAQRAIMPGTLDLTFSSWSYTDDAQGNVIYAGSTVGTVDYESGKIDLTGYTFPFGGSGGGNYLHYKPAAVITQSVHSARTVIQLQNRGYNYVASLLPIPAPGSLSIAYMAQGRWYSISDNGTGNLTGVEGGSGTPSYTTGSVVVTLAAFPEIIYNWGSPAHFEVGAAGSYPIELPVFEHDFAVPLVPGTVSVTWPGSSLTDAAGDGLLTGNGVGYVDYATGKVQIKPSTYPAANTIINFGASEASVAPEDKITEAATATLTGSTADFTLGAAPIEPGTVRLDWTVNTTIIGSIGTTLHSTALTALDDGNGTLRIDGQNVGTINYTTGACSMTATNPQPAGNQWVSQSGNSTTAEWRDPTTTYLIDNGVINAAYLAAGTAISPLAQTGQITVSSLQIDLTPDTANALVAGSVLFKLNSKTYFDRSGVLYNDHDTDNGSATAVGSVDYSTGLVTISAFNSGAVSDFTVYSLLTQFGLWQADRLYFRTPGAPIQPASLAFRANLWDGTQVTATSAFDGTITADKINGTIDYETGIVSIEFGVYVLDSGLSEDDKALGWYNAANVDENGYIWRPEPIMPDTAFFNCVTYDTLPLSADILGLDPVRLPIDGRVPIFRDGDVVILHNTETETLPVLAVSGTHQLSQINITSYSVTDATTATVNSAKYRLDTTTGIITLDDDTGITQPLTVRHRIEDMVLVNDVQINGRMATIAQISHDYPAGASASSALLCNPTDLQARVSYLFDPQPWTGAWSDTLIGSEPSAEYNDTTYPLTVTNRGCITEKWAIIFTSSTSFRLIGQNVGEIATGDVSTTLQPTNPNTGSAYFTLNPLGWGAGWATGNVLRFNTIGAMFEFWVSRTTLQGAATGSSDSFGFNTFGNANG